MRHDDGKRVREAFARSPSWFMKAHEAGGKLRIRRIIPDMPGSPILAFYLPDSLAQFAAVFARDDDRTFADSGFSVDIVYVGSLGSTDTT